MLILQHDTFPCLPDMDSPVRLGSPSSPLKSTTPSPNSKQYSTPESRSPGYTQTRRPAGGSSRPLPSPGKSFNAVFTPRKQHTRVAAAS